MNKETSIRIEYMARDFVTRAVGVVGLGGIALIHLLDSISKFSETPYIAWMYVALMIGSVTVAAGLVHLRDRRLWLAAGLLAASAIVGYVLSRTTGLPNSTGDIGNWNEPLGIASLFVEGFVVAVSAYAFRAARGSGPLGQHQDGAMRLVEHARRRAAEEHPADRAVHA